MKKYWKTFFHKMKLFLLYFIKISKNSIMILKKYWSNYRVKKWEKRLIIIIIYDENIFFGNNKYKKI